MSNAGILRILELEALKPDSETSLLKRIEFLGIKPAEDDFLRLIAKLFCCLRRLGITFWGISKANFIF